jgi:hypothetical protein
MNFYDFLAKQSYTNLHVVATGLKINQDELNRVVNKIDFVLLIMEEVQSASGISAVRSHINSMKNQAKNYRRERKSVFSR